MRAGKAEWCCVGKVFNAKLAEHGPQARKGDRPPAAPQARGNRAPDGVRTQKTRFQPNSERSSRTVFGCDRRGPQRWARVEGVCVFVFRSPIRASVLARRPTLRCGHAAGGRSPLRRSAPCSAIRLRGSAGFWVIRRGQAMERSATSRPQARLRAGR